MRKYVSVVRIIAIVALCYTIILWLGLWGSSLVPSDKSGDMTTQVQDKVNAAFSVQDKIDSNKTVQSVSVYIEDRKSYYFFDDHPRIVTKVEPANAVDSELELTVGPAFAGAGDATIDDDGIITFTKAGMVKVTATLKSDPSIWDIVTFTCFGVEPLPDDETLPSIELKDGDFDNMQVGKMYQLKFNDNKTTFDCVKVEVEDDSIVAYDLSCLYTRKAGSTKIYVTVTNGTITKVIEKDIVTYGELPEIPSITFKSIEDIEENIELRQGQYIKKYELLDNIDKSNDLYRCIVTSSDVNIVYSSSSDYINARGSGKVTLTYTSLFDPEKSASIEIEIQRIPMEYMKMIGSDIITPSDSIKYKVETYPANYVEDVEWSVLEGKASITQDGILTAETYGTVVIRCQSLYDPSIYVDKTVKVQLYSSSYSFVRKFMGHMGLSAVLGFGLFFTAILLCPKKWQTVFIVPLSFGYAGISELLQKLAPGRWCLFNDVLIDFIGTLIGMAVGIVLYAMILIIWRLINKNSYKKLTEAIKGLNFRNVFRSVDYILSVNDSIEPSLAISPDMVTTDIVDDTSLENVSSESENEESENSEE